MANRYAVATGNWNATGTWSASSGGSAGASAPVAGDNVFLDAASGAITVTLSVQGACSTLTCTGFTGTLALLYNVLTVAGNVTLAPTMAVTVTTTGKINVSGTLTLTTNGCVVPFLQFVGYGGVVTFADNVTVDTLVFATYTTFVGAVTVTCARLLSVPLNNVVLPPGLVLVVTTQLYLSLSSIGSGEIRSSTASSPVFLVFTGTPAECRVAQIKFTDIDASRGGRIDNWYGNTLTRCKNIVNRTSADLVRPPRTRTLKGRQ